MRSVRLGIVSADFCHRYGEVIATESSDLGSFCEPCGEVTDLRWALQEIAAMKAETPSAIAEAFKRAQELAREAIE